MRRPKIINPPPPKAMVTIRLPHSVHQALIVLSHEERTSIQKLVERWINRAIAGNEVAAGILKRQRQIEKIEGRKPCES